MTPFCSSTRKSGKYFPGDLGSQKPPWLSCSVLRIQRSDVRVAVDPCRALRLLAVHVENQIEGVLAKLQAPQEAARRAIVLLLDLDGELLGSLDRVGLVLESATPRPAGSAQRPCSATFARSRSASTCRRRTTTGKLKPRSPQEILDRAVQPRLAFLERQPQERIAPVQFAVEPAGQLDRASSRRPRRSVPTASSGRRR